jgi:hypothetical protein
MAARLKAHPEIVLADLVTANSGGNGSRDVRVALIKTATDETGCFRQIRLFSRVLHILLPVYEFRAGVAHIVKMRPLPQFVYGVNAP